MKNKKILVFIGLDEDAVKTVNYKDIRKKVNEVYPAINPVGANYSYPSNDALIRDRKKILNTSRHLLYELNAIRSREQNANG